MLKEDWNVMNDELAGIQKHDIILRIPFRERVRMVFTGAFHLHAEIFLKINAFRIHKISVKAVRARRNSHE